MNFINLNKTKQSTLILNKPGDYLAFFHNLSGKFIFDIQNENINIDIYGLYTGQDKESYKVETIQNHRNPNSKSNLLIKGVFNGQAEFNYQGLIRIEKAAHNSYAYQKNQNLVLSKHVFIESKPYLEILNNDVFCTHGSTTSGLDEEEKYYLMSRGIKLREAEKLLVQGFINEILEKIKKYE